MWTVICFLLLSLFYLSLKISIFLNFFKKYDILERKKQLLISASIIFVLFGIITLFINFMNAIVCALYFSMIWCIIDIIFYFLKKIYKIQNFKHYYVGWISIILSIISLIIGRYLDHNVWKTEYNLITEKNISNLKIAMFADSHLGTTFNADGFEKKLEMIQKENPDIIFIVGDYVDDETNKDDMIKATKNLGKIKTKYGIYFVFGNHDKGYYGSSYRGFSSKELINELKNNNVSILQDESILINNDFYLIGRIDYSEVKEKNKKRKTIKELIKNLDKKKYMIVLDHQPVEFKEKSEAKVDLVLAGHTHSGQLFPFNQVGKWIGANDLIYGYEKRDNTNFIVTSGISDWAIKFKTGTKSEFVVINIKKEINK